MGITIWFTGLSGSGKTTIAYKLKGELESQKKRVCVLDGDVIRETFHQNLGFSREDIRENNRLIAEMAKERIIRYDIVLVTVISPFQEDRAMVREIVGDGFIELFIQCPLNKCKERDPKGLYKKAFAGEIDNFIGVSKDSPYEPPENSEIVIDTTQEIPEECAEKIIRYLKKNKLL